MGETNPSVIEQLEEAIRQKLGAGSDREYTSAGGTKALAGILNHADRSLERTVLDSLATSDEGLAEEVRGMLFVFEDIVKLEERAIQQVLRDVDQKDLVLALRGAPEDVKEALLANMSERGAAMLKEEMEIQPPQRKRDVDDAQSRVVGVVRKLEEAGTIVISTGERRGRGRRSGCLRRPSATPSSSSSPPIRRHATRPPGRSPRPWPRRRRSASRHARRASSRAGPPGTSWGRPRCRPPPRASTRRSQGVQALGQEVSDAVERDAIELALELAGKVILATLQIRPELVVEVVQGALRRVSGQRTIAILVNPVDLETVRVGAGRPAVPERRRRAVGSAVRPAGAARRRDRPHRRRRGRRPRPDPARAGRRGRSQRARPSARRLQVSAPAAPGALLERASEAIREADLARRHGFVSNLIGLIIEATGLQAEVGEVCLVGTDRGRRGADPVPPRWSASGKAARC